MFLSENDLLANLIVLSPKVARKRFRNSIFEAWNWKCAYCDCCLTGDTATIDHIVPKRKGGHSTRNNLCCSCTRCNRSKATKDVFEYMNETHPNYSKERVSRINTWMKQETCSLKIFDNKIDGSTLVPRYAI